MKHKRFTLSYYEGEDRGVKLPDGFNSIALALNWAGMMHIPLSVLSITEWDIDSVDDYGTPDIIASANLEEVEQDQVGDLSKYIIW